MSLLSLHSSQVALGSGSALEQKQNLSHAILFTLLALAAMAGHFILVANFDVFGFLWIIGVMMMSFFLSSELVFALVMTSLFLQNVFVAILSPQIKDVNHFSVMLASSFVIIALAAMAAMFIWNQLRHRLPTDSRAMLRGLIFFFIVVVIYTVIGAVFSNLVSALVYTRVYLTGGMLLALGVTLGLGAPLNYAINVIRLMALILIVWGIVEFLLTYDLYALFHVVEYMNLKFASVFDKLGFGGITEAIDYQSGSYLNLSGAFGLDFYLLRPNGPNLHPISYAYALAFCSLVCFICRSHFLMAGCLILALLVGAKGPLVMLIMSLVLYVFHTNFRKQPRVVLIALVCSLVFYVATGLVYGMYTKDYHVIGFMGGINGFISNPLGHGIGVGGNLSALAKTETNFQVFQNYGANFALESALGVMLYQIGVGTAVFCLFYWRFWKSVWKAALFFSTEPRLVVVPFALAFLFANCIFQEEALSPAGWGLWLLFSGLLLAKYWKLQAVQKV